MKKLLRLSLVMALVASIGALAPGAVLADTTVTIDFEGLLDGRVVSSVSSGSGISGAAIGGPV